MKLRNKKTGDIYELNEFCLYDNKGFAKRPFLKSLAELTEEWEDYEEPEGWCVTMYGGITRVTKNDEILFPDLKGIGNWFNDKESAYDALDKLKAWERLKDKGFRFIGVRGIGKVIDFDIPEPYNHIGFDEYETNNYDEKEFYDDLLLLFGGEE